MREIKIIDAVDVNAKTSQENKSRGATTNHGIIHRDVKSFERAHEICMLNFLIAIVLVDDLAELQQPLEPLGVTVREAHYCLMIKGRDGDELAVLLRDEHAVDAHVGVVVGEPRLEDAGDSDAVDERIAEEVNRELLDTIQ